MKDIKDIKDIKGFTNEDRKKYKDIYGPIISAHNKKKTAERISAGRFTGKAPFGYKWIHEGSQRKGFGTLEIIPEQAEIIKAMFDIYKQNLYSVYHQNKTINEKYSINMSDVSYYNIVKNKFYIGYLQSGEKHIYPTILDKETWEQVQKIRERKKFIRTKLYTDSPSLFRTVFICSICDCTISSEYKKTRRGAQTNNIYYRCTGSKYDHKPRRINQTNLKIEFKRILKECNLECDIDSIAQLDLRKFCNEHFDLLSINQKGDIEYVLKNSESKQINKADKQIPFVGDIRIISVCKIPQTIENLLEITNIPLDELQSQLIDLQLAGYIDQDFDGKWKTL